MAIVAARDAHHRDIEQLLDLGILRAKLYHKYETFKEWRFLFTVVATTAITTSNTASVTKSLLLRTKQRKTTVPCALA